MTNKKAPRTSSGRFKTCKENFETTLKTENNNGVAD